MFKPYFRGARINRHDKDNFSPLLIAGCNGHAETIKTLLSKGANLFDVDKNDKTALFWASEEDHAGALKVQFIFSLLTQNILLLNLNVFNFFFKCMILLSCLSK